MKFYHVTTKPEHSAASTLNMKFLCVSDKTVKTQSVSAPAGRLTSGPKSRRLTAEQRGAVGGETPAAQTRHHVQAASRAPVAPLLFWM